MDTCCSMSLEWDSLDGFPMRLLFDSYGLRALMLLTEHFRMGFFVWIADLENHL